MQKIRRYVIFGAGAIGATVGARLHQSGRAVDLIARGAHAQALKHEGLKLVDPNGTVQLGIDTHTSPVALGEDFFADEAFHTVVFLCMKSQHTEDALRDLARVAPLQTPVVCMQNGVANERTALRYFPRTYGALVNLPATHLRPGEVVTHAQGRGGILDTGCYPHGMDALGSGINADLSAAGFSAEPDANVMRKKYAKLLMNLGNILQAALRDGEDPEPLGRAMRAEALACYTAAGIDCAGRDEVKARQQGVYRMAAVPGYERTAGSSWQSVQRGSGDIETEYLNGEICLLGRLHGVATPVNDACVAIARRLIALGRGPGQFGVPDFPQVAEQPRASRLD